MLENLSINCYEIFFHDRTTRYVIAMRLALITSTVRRWVHAQLLLHMFWHPNEEDIRDNCKLAKIRQN